ILRGTFLFVALGLFAAPAAPQEKYAIRSYEPKKGDRARETDEETEVFRLKVIDDQGDTKEEKQEKTVKSHAFKETILEKPDGKRATRLRREYEKARVAKDGKERTLPYEGKTVLIEKKGDRYRFQIEGGKPLAGKDAEELNKEFNEFNIDTSKLDKLMVPEKPVAVGEGWEIDAAAVVKELLSGNEDIAVDVPRAKVTGKLVRAYRKDGKQFGVLEYMLDLPLKAFKVEDEKIPLLAGSKMFLKVEMDGCIDGSDVTADVKVTGGMSVSAVIKDEDGKAKAKMNLSTDVSGKETHRPLQGK